MWLRMEVSRGPQHTNNRVNLLLKPYWVNRDGSRV
jgi:hypothetical protein